MTGYSFSTPAVATGPLTVNGPEDEAPDWDAIDWCPRRPCTAAAAKDLQGDLQGDAGAGLGQGPVPAEDDATVLVEHADQRAPGDPAQCWPHDRGGGRGDRADPGPQDGGGDARAPDHLLL